VTLYKTTPTSTGIVSVFSMFVSTIWLSNLVC